MTQTQGGQEPEKCPGCRGHLSHAPGIGPYCPNRACDRVDDVSPREPERDADDAADEECSKHDSGKGKPIQGARECWISYDKDGSRRAVTHHEWVIDGERKKGYEVRHYREVTQGAREWRLERGEDGATYAVGPAISFFETPRVREVTHGASPAGVEAMAKAMFHMDYSALWDVQESSIRESYKGKARKILDAMAQPLEPGGKE